MGCRRARNDQRVRHIREVLVVSLSAAGVRAQVTSETSSPNKPAPGKQTPREVLREALSELEMRLRRGEAKSLERVLAVYPSLVSDKELVLEMVYTEYVVRQEMGHDMPLDEWIRRFPQWEQDLRELFQVHEYLSSAAVGTQSSMEQPIGETFQDWRDLPAAASRTSNRLGKFELLEPIGRGGMGVVYRARQIGLDRIVALKTIRSLGEVHHDVLRRFRAEVDTVASLQHPNIVPIFDVGLDEGIPYFAMEYVPGGSLAALIRSHPLPPRAAAQLAKSLAKAVHYAHEQGVIHRDLKPANVLLAPSAQPDAVELIVPADPATVGPLKQLYQPKITDFGLARRRHDDSRGTLPGAALGTPSYMAPEQAVEGGAAAGPAADVYSLGAILYDMLVGRPPFLAASPLETLERVKHDEPVSIRSVQPDTPRDLELICLKCLHKDPQRRYVTADALADDLNRFLTGRPILARSASLWERAVKWSRRHSALTGLIATLIVGVLAVLSQWIRAERNRSLAEKQTDVARQAQDVERRERLRAESMLYARDVSLAYSEFSANNTTRARQLLDGCPMSFRDWEWDYLNHICRQEVWDFPDLGQSVWCTAVTLDGRFVAGGTGAWGTNRRDLIKVWNIETGHVQWTLNCHPSSIMQLSFSPDGRSLASAGVHWQRMMPLGGVKIWSMETGAEIAAIPEVNAFSVEYSPDGKWLAVGSDNGTLILWDVVGKRVVWSLRVHSQMVLDLAWHPDAQVLASCSRDGTVKLHDLEGQPLDGLSGLGDTRRIDFSPSGLEIAVGGYSGLVRLYALRNGRLVELNRFSNHDYLLAMRFAPDGQAVAVSSQFAGIRLVDPLTGYVQREFHGHNGVARDFAFDRTGMLLATVGDDGNVKVWDTSRLSQPATMRFPGGHMIAAQFVDDNRVAIGMGQNIDRPGVRFDGDMIRIWDSRAGKVVAHFSGHRDWLTDLALDRSRRRILTSSLDRTVALWDADNGQRLGELAQFAATPQRVDFLDNDQWAVCLSDDGQMQAWEVGSASAASGMVSTASSHQNSRVPTTKLIAAPIRATMIAGSPMRPYVIAANRSGQIAAVSLSEPERAIVREVDEQLRCLTISPDEQWLAVGCVSGKILLWRLDQSALQIAAAPDQVIAAHTGSVESIAFSPNGKRLVTLSLDTSLRIWDLQSRQQVLLLEGPLNDVCQLAISPEFRTIVMTNRTLVSQWVRQGSERMSVIELQRDGEHRRRWCQDQMASAQTNQAHFATLFYAELLSEMGVEPAVWQTARATALAGMGRRAEAIASFESAPPESRSAADEAQLALLYLAQADVNRYQNVCQRLTARMSPGTNPAEMNRALWPLAFARFDSGVPTDVLPFVEIMLARGRTADALNTAGAIYFRAGQVERAIELLSEAQRRRTGAEVVFDQVFIALAYHRLGQTEYAGRLIKDVREWVENQQRLIEYGRAPHAIFHWLTQLELELLLDEAANLLH